MFYKAVEICGLRLSGKNQLFNRHLNGRISVAIAIFFICCTYSTIGQTQQQINMVNVYGAYLPMEIGMEMVANKFPALAERANAAKAGIQQSFLNTLAYIDNAISTGLPDGRKKWPELKRNTRRQAMQLLTTPSSVEDATRVIQTVEQAVKGEFPPTLRAAIADLPLSAHPAKCGCDKCSR